MQATSDSVLYVSTNDSMLVGRTSRENRGAHRAEYLRNYQRAWIRQRRASYFETQSCDRCGSTASLELHHRNPAEKVHHRIWSWSQARRASELAKCVALCSDCHTYLTRLDLASRQRTSASQVGSNITLDHKNQLWRVRFTIMGRRLWVGGGFKNYSTASAAAGSFRSMLAAHYAKQHISVQISRRKQLSLFEAGQQCA